MTSNPCCEKCECDGFTRWKGNARKQRLANNCSCQCHKVAVRCTDCTWEGDIVMANCERHKIIPKPHKEVASGENWESEFDADAKDSTDGQFATLIVSRAMYHQLTQPAGADASHITKKLMARIATIRAETIAEVLGKMDLYLEHTDDCIRSHCSQGRPKADGGYEQMFRGKWYQALPIDETPKCDCGLTELATALRMKDTMKKVDEQVGHAVRRLGDN